MNQADDNREEASPIQWNIQREGRAWTGDEIEARFNRLMELKFEVIDGKLFWDEEPRLAILGMLLENVGMDAALRLGDLERWKEAIATVERERG